MKTIKMIVVILALSAMYQFAEAQSGCTGNKFRMVKGSYRCGCHCQKKCVAAQDTAAYKANSWYFGTDCFGSCCWIRNGEDVLYTLPTETSFTEIYPNPASGSVTIAFTLGQQGEVTLDVFDVTGRYVTTIAHNVFEGESSEVTWDASSVNQGIYFIQMKAGSFSATKRISVIRNSYSTISLRYFCFSFNDERLRGKKHLNRTSFVLRRNT